MVLDGASSLSSSTRRQLEAAITKNLTVFGRDLPGYNGEFGPVMATFEFASQTRPVPQKARFPGYGTQAQLLFNVVILATIEVFFCL